jgi:hypothetical protein
VLNINGVKFRMSADKSNKNLAGLYVDAKDVDISHATLDGSLAKVWVDDAVGELAVSLERVLFDGLLDVAARYLEPHGFSLNLENLLAMVDSMRIGVFASVSSKKAVDGRFVAKKIMPNIFMHLPRKKTVGPLLQKFYDEVGRYESELARLQEVEAKSKKVMNAAIKDESGRKTAEILLQENTNMRDELTNMSRKLARAEEQLRAAPGVQGDHQLPVGVRSCVVRGVRVSESVVMFKVGDAQFSVPLKSLSGVPAINARGLSFYESGVLKSVWVFDPKPEAFSTLLAEVVAVDGRRAKLRFRDRREQIVTMAVGESLVAVGTPVIARFAGGFLVDLSSVGLDGKSVAADLIYDQQTKKQLESIFSREVA